MHNYRKQYHGNYHGLIRVVIQGISKGMITPQVSEWEEGNEVRVMTNPAFSLRGNIPHLKDKDKLRFDNSLRYSSTYCGLTCQKRSSYI
ncbi:hypothetical protein DRJ25_04840 [Candidatus Woesearchaeota archaeon]|nr:MAG: hypothetical protein DRJ25_04840 [Candidatus Woesearchaeota archaeon]